MKEEKPTREERLNAYEFAREWLNDNMDNVVGICTLLRKAIYPRCVILSHFPEFIEAKPKDKDVGGYWFSSAKERIQVLTKIINKMKEDPIREELKALREDVEKLKVEKKIIEQKELIKGAREIMDNICDRDGCLKVSMIMDEENPKEYPERLIIEGGSTIEFSISDLPFKAQTLEIKHSFQDMVIHSYFDKKEAIKIVNYLKNNFDIKD